MLRLRHLPLHVRQRRHQTGRSPLGPRRGERLAVEAAGWSVAGELYDRNLLRLGPVVPGADGDPCKRIARQAFRNRTGPRSFYDRPATVLAEVERRQADAVVFWLYEEDEAIAWDVVDARTALEDNGIATLVMARRRWDLEDEPQGEIHRFLAGPGA